MQRHTKILQLGREKVKMTIEAPDDFNLSKVSITFASPDAEKQTKQSGDWRKDLIQKEFGTPKKKKKKPAIGFAAISASVRKC